MELTTGDLKSIEALKQDLQSHNIENITVGVFNSGKYHQDTFFYESFNDFWFAIKDNDYKFCGAGNREIYIEENNEELTFHIEAFCFASPYDEIVLN